MSNLRHCHHHSHHHHHYHHHHTPYMPCVRSGVAASSFSGYIPSEIGNSLLQLAFQTYFDPMVYMRLMWPLSYAVAVEHPICRFVQQAPYHSYLNSEQIATASFQDGFPLKFSHKTWDSCEFPFIIIIVVIDLG